MWAIAGTVIDQSHTNHDISVYTTNTSNGILSVLTIRAVPINVGNDAISIACILITEAVFFIKSATLTIRRYYLLLKTFQKM